MEYHVHTRKVKHIDIQKGKNGGKDSGNYCGNPAGGVSKAEGWNLRLHPCARTLRNCCRGGRQMTSCAQCAWTVLVTFDSTAAILFAALYAAQSWSNAPFAVRASLTRMGSCSCLSMRTVMMRYHLGAQAQGVICKASAVLAFLGLLESLHVLSGAGLCSKCQGPRLGVAGFTCRRRF